MDFTKLRVKVRRWFIWKNHCKERWNYSDSLEHKICEYLQSQAKWVFLLIERVNKTRKPHTIHAHTCEQKHIQNLSLNTMSPLKQQECHFTWGMLILAISLKKYRWDMLDLSKKHLHIKAKLNRRKSITTLIFRINDLFSLGYFTLKVQVRHGWLIKVASLHKGKIK